MFSVVPFITLFITGLGDAAKFPVTSACVTPVSRTFFSSLSPVKLTI